MGIREIKMQQWSDKYCRTCGKRMNKWDERCYKALRDPPTCEKCLAVRYEKTVPELNDFLQEWYNIRSCQFK